jgi:hypothetical protein
MVSVREVSLMIVGSMVALVLNVIYNKSLEWLSKLEVKDSKNALLVVMSGTTMVVVGAVVVVWLICKVFGERTQTIEGRRSINDRANSTYNPNVSDVSLLRSPNMSCIPNPMNSTYNVSSSSSRLNDTRIIKACREPSVFKKGVDAKAWFTRFKFFVRERNIPQDQIFSVLLSYMDDDNMRVVENSTPFNQANDLEFLEAFFVELYEDKCNTIADRKREFYARKQRETEGITSYLSELNQLAKLAWPGVGSNEQLDWEVLSVFVDGLVDEAVRKGVKQSRPANTADALAEAKRINFTLNNSANNRAPTISSTQNTIPSAPTQQVNNQQRSVGALLTCGHCGRAGHATVRCRDKLAEDERNNLANLQSLQQNNFSSQQTSNLNGSYINQPQDRTPSPPAALRQSYSFMNQQTPTLSSNQQQSTSGTSKI